MSAIREDAEGFYDVPDFALPVLPATRDMGALISGHVGGRTDRSLNSL